MAIYTVNPGDTLAQIATRFATTVADIQAANRIENINLIFPGQRLLIPGIDTAKQKLPSAVESGAVYVVRKGDTLAKIAASQGMSTRDLLEHNPQITDPDLISIGELLNVPEGLETTSGKISRVIPPTTEGEPLWLAFAKKEMESDVEEVGGTRHNPRILEYHATTSLRANKDETPWCSSFVNWCVTQADLEGTNRANARSWLRWGEPLVKPQIGAVAVFWRGRRNDGVTGHVGFFLEDEGSTVKLLGGNQGDRVSIKNQDMRRFLGFRYPRSS